MMKTRERTERNRNSATQDPAHYLSLQYPIEVRRLSKGDGGGWVASIPFLGRFAFMAVGESVEEALSLLDEVKQTNFEDYLQRGIPIPDPPIPPEEEEFSGRFVLRVPKNLHRQLSSQAADNEVSLNQYAVSLLSQAVAREDVADRCVDRVRQAVEEGCDRLEHSIKGIAGETRVMTIETNAPRFREILGELQISYDPKALAHWPIRSAHPVVERFWSINDELGVVGNAQTS